MKKAFLFVYILSGFMIAQTNSFITKIPRDTSFTVYSALKKIISKYPLAKIVETQNFKEVLREESVVYASNGKRSLHADVFSPKNHSIGPFPGVILIHGGGWRSGDKTQQNPMAEELALKGYVAASVEYRLSIEALYPAGVYDIKAAIRWLRSQATRYNIDTTRIAVLGCSAGGQLASLIGTTNGIARFEGNGENPERSSSVQAIVNIDGLIDFTDIDSRKFDNDTLKPSAAALWFGGQYTKLPDVWKEASALTYTGSKTPPILFINSILPHYHAGRDNMIAILDKYHIYHEQYTIADTPHPFWLYHPWYEETMTHITAFLHTVFQKK